MGLTIQRCSASVYDNVNVIYLVENVEVESDLLHIITKHFRH